VPVRGVLVDAGPFVALIDRRDNHHERCVEALRAMTDPLVTVWPALVEAMYLLDGWQEQAALWAMVEAGPITLAHLGDEDVPHLRKLMARYRDLPMDLADAALVHVAERDGYRRVFSLDRTDFEVYRVAGRERFTILPVAPEPARPRRRSSRSTP
jgi:predicted nucleic acid-binding protein